eukprot:5614727-Amphidinium_carterae.10
MSTRLALLRPSAPTPLPISLIPFPHFSLTTCHSPTLSSPLSTGAGARGSTRVAIHKRRGPIKLTSFFWTRRLSPPALQRPRSPGASLTRSKSPITGRFWRHLSLRPTTHSPPVNLGQFALSPMTHIAHCLRRTFTHGYQNIILLH